MNRLVNQLSLNGNVILYITFFILYENMQYCKIRCKMVLFCVFHNIKLPRLSFNILNNRVTFGHVNAACLE